VFCNPLAQFLTDFAAAGWDVAVKGLDSGTGTAVLAMAAVFGITEACKSDVDRRKAVDLAEEFKKLAKQQSTTLELVRSIVDQEVGVTLDQLTQWDLAETIVTALREGGVVTSLPSDNFAEAGVIPNADFVGRVEILKDLHKRLEQGDVAITHDLPGVEASAQALRGEGGIGKTQIAIRYAYEHADDYDGRWWIDASKEAIDASAALLATVLGRPPGPQDTPEQICTAIRAKLSNDKHLLILDNVEDATRVQGFLLRAPSRVLITTRLGSLPTGFVHEFPVSVFERSESVELLRKHRSDLAEPEHENALGRVGDHLGDHALAVTLAASYLRKRPSVTPGELLERLEQAELGNKEHLLEKLDPNEHTAGYRLSVARSLSLHLPDFSETPAMDILAVAAFCHPDNIPIDLLSDTPDLSPESVED
jgi:hypothetical protein